MPAFSAGEVQLLQNYLNKAHQYKKAMGPQERGLVLDNLQWVGNPIAGCAYRNMGPLVVTPMSRIATPMARPFQLCERSELHSGPIPAGGDCKQRTMASPPSMGPTTSQRPRTTPRPCRMGRVQHVLWQHGDWDNRNNFLRAPGQRSGADQRMGWNAPLVVPPTWVGETTAMVLLSMNNTTDYQPQNGGCRAVPTIEASRLMAYPLTLRMHMVAPPAALQVTNNGGRRPSVGMRAPIMWLATTCTSSMEHGRFLRGASHDNRHSHQSPPFHSFVAGKEYMVRAVKLQTSKSGTYYNLSSGPLQAAGTRCRTARVLRVVPPCPVRRAMTAIRTRVTTRGTPTGTA